MTTLNVKYSMATRTFIYSLTQGLLYIAWPMTLHNAIKSDIPDPPKLTQSGLWLRLCPWNPRSAPGGNCCKEWDVSTKCPHRQRCSWCYLTGICNAAREGITTALELSVKQTSQAPSNSAGHSQPTQARRSRACVVPASGLRLLHWGRCCSQPSALRRANLCVWFI